MVHEILRAQNDPNGEQAEAKRKAILAADAIICVSENTRKDLLERYSIPEEKIRVIYQASDIDASLSYGPEQVPSRPYYLYVGSRAHYKNFDGLLRAFEKTVSVKPELTLCVVGSPFTAGESRLIGDLRLTTHVQHFRDVSDSHLAKLYRCSLALVYPSFYEGFGIPPLEAMSCATVAIVSNVSSLPEVVGDAGLMFDPNSVDELTEIMRELPDNPAIRESLIAKGLARARKFSWDRTVDETVEVYKAVSANDDRLPLKPGFQIASSRP
jgi:glycosyltransferase involved in cell wall biosynthesis